MVFMPRAIIFANGELNPPLPDPTSFKSEDNIIAADGGALHCMKLGITPNTLIGDFDSLTSGEISTLQNAGVQILRYSPHKDETDLELAILHAIQQDVDQIIIFGALGARLDMTLANLMLLTHSSFTHTRLSLIDGNQEISLLRGEQSVHLHGKAGDIVSLIPLSTESSGINTRDLEYSLLDGTLTIGSPRGVSNMMLCDHCQVTLKHGLLAVVHLRQ
jgi:thiamine pyrophosphokinase